MQKVLFMNMQKVYLCTYIIIIINGIEYVNMLLGRSSKYLGPVVQSIVSLTASLRCQFVKYMPTTLSNPLLFFVGKM